MESIRKVPEAQVISAPQPEQNEEDEDKEHNSLGFEEQYERMIKKQLGGLLSDYLNHLSGKKEPHSIQGTQRQYDNMCSTVEEFKVHLQDEFFSQNHINLRRVEDMPNKLQLKKQYAELMDHKTSIKEMPLIVTASS